MSEDARLSRRAAAAGLGLVGTLIVTAILSIVVGIQLWPSVIAVSNSVPGISPRVPRVPILGLVDWTPDPDSVYIVLVVLAGGLGATIHALTSLTSYLGNRQFRTSWFGWYLARYLIGASLALVFYFLLRGGLLSTVNGVQSVNPYATVAIAGLTGMFSKQATDKLEEVFDTLFRTSEGGDSDRSDKLASTQEDKE